MADVYKTVEITGTSGTSIDDAVQVALAKASETIRNLDWFQVGDIRGTVADGRLDQFQVTLKLGFRLE